MPESPEAARNLENVRVDVVGVVNETADRLDSLPRDIPAATALAHARNGFGAANLVGFLLYAQSSGDRAHEYRAISLAARDAITQIDDVVDESLLDDVVDLRVFPDAAELSRIRVSVRSVREAAESSTKATEALLAGLAMSADIAAPLGECAAMTGIIASGILTLLMGPTRDRRIVAADIYAQTTVIDAE